MNKQPSPAVRGGAAARLGLDCLYLAGAVLLIPWFVYRRFIKRKASAPLKARLGFIPARSPEAQRVWIHAVSVGEAVAAQTLVKTLRQRLPHLEIVVSTTTVTGQEVAAKKYGFGQVFYYPLDLSCAVRRALIRLRPAILVLMELEVWPNMLAETCRRNIPVIVANGRLTERSAGRYRRFWFLVGTSFRRVRMWLVQSDEYAIRLKTLGVDPQRLTIAGNMKYDDVEISDTGPAERARLRKALSIPENAPVLIGGSTHPSEEAALLAAFVQLRKGPVPDLRLILAPRHLERLKDVLADIAAAGCTALRRSEMREAAGAKGEGQGEPPVLVLDTMGELKTMYQAADVAFVGGSLIPHGGQNPMEPCGLGVAVIHGPFMQNFNDAVEILRSCRGALEVDRNDLAAAIEKLLLNRGEAAAMAARARESFLKAQGATDRVVECIEELLKE
jgi:3-deoxy-D-manno-octulosonic-acid transferase